MVTFLLYSEHFPLNFFSSIPSPLHTQGGVSKLSALLRKDNKRPTGLILESSLTNSCLTPTQSICSWDAFRVAISQPGIQRLWLEQRRGSDLMKTLSSVITWVNYHQSIPCLTSLSSFKCQVPGGPDTLHFFSFTLHGFNFCFLIFVYMWVID